jgi:hypothetical protein
VNAIVVNPFLTPAAPVSGTVQASVGSVTVAGLTPTVGASASSYVSVRTAADNDVAQFDHGTNAFNRGWDTMFPLEISASQYGCHVRWQLNVPQGATITSVTVSFYEAQLNGEYSSGDALETVGFAASDNLAQLASSTDYLTAYNSMPTTTTMSMSVVTGGDAYDTRAQNTLVAAWSLPVAVLQHVVSRAGWSSGNYVGFFMRTSGSDAYIAQWQAHATRSASYTPMLEVEYTT